MPIEKQKPVATVTATNVQFAHGIGPRQEIKVKPLNGHSFAAGDLLYTEPQNVITESQRQQAESWVGIQEALQTVIPHFGIHDAGKKTLVQYLSDSLVDLAARMTRIQVENHRHQSSIRRLQRRVTEAKNNIAELKGQGKSYPSVPVVGIQCDGVFQLEGGNTITIRDGKVSSMTRAPGYLFGTGQTGTAKDSAPAQGGNGVSVGIRDRVGDVEQTYSLSFGASSLLGQPSCRAWAP